MSETRTPRSDAVIETRFAAAAVGITTILGVGLAPAAALVGSNYVSEPVLLGVAAAVPTLVAGVLVMGHVAYHYG